MRMSLIAIAALALFLHSGFGAQATTTGDYVNQCTDAGADKQKLCSDYITYVDGDSYRQRGCSADEGNHAVSAVFDWLSRHQEVWSLDSYIGVMQALKVVYPCR